MRQSLDFFAALMIVLALYLLYKQARNEKRIRKQKQARQTTRPLEAAETKPSESPEDLKVSPFSEERLYALGLDRKEAIEFVHELITQIEMQLPMMKKALSLNDYTTLERISHSLKGSASNIGTGGVTDLLNNYNTYLKGGDDPRIASSYLQAIENELRIMKKTYEIDLERE